MRIIKEVSIILIISFIGEILNKTLPLPVPACIYGLLIMLFLLMTKILKIENIELVGRHLIQIMPLLFIPAGVSIIESFDILKPLIIPITVITFVSTIVVMVISGKVTEHILKRKSKEQK